MIPPFVDQTWLDAHPEAVLVDVRRDTPTRSALDGFADGHRPGAVLVDLDRRLAGPPTTAAGRHPLPTPEHFAEGMARLGVGDDTTVVACDDEGGVIAARLVWMLRTLGHDAALLDAPADRFATGPVEPTPATFTPRPWPASALADATAAEDPANVVLDARSRDRFDGAPSPLDPRPGHIPGARSMPCLDNVDSDGRLLDDDVLRGRLTAVGVVPGVDVVSYCGSGVTACHTLLLQEHLGLGRGRLYPGSWSAHAHR